MMLGSWRRTWTGGSAWSRSFCPATSPHRSSSATAASSAPNPPFWFASATLTTSYSRGRSSWRDWPRACRRSWRRLTVGRGRVPSCHQALPPALPLSSPLWFPAPPMQAGPLLWHHCDAIDRPLLGVAVKDGEWRRDNRLPKNSLEKKELDMKEEWAWSRLCSHWDNYADFTHKDETSSMRFILFTPDTSVHLNIINHRLGLYSTLTGHFIKALKVHPHIL